MTAEIEIFIEKVSFILWEFFLINSNLSFVRHNDRQVSLTEGLEWEFKHQRRFFDTHK